MKHLDLCTLRALNSADMKGEQGHSEAEPSTKSGGAGQSESKPAKGTHVLAKGEDETQEEKVVPAPEPATVTAAATLTGPR